MDDSLCLLAGWFIPAYSGFIELDRYKLGFHVSVLGPCYGIRCINAPGEPAARDDLAREIETSYPGHQHLPQPIGDEVVPDVCLDGRPFGEATIYHCLLSQEWEHTSGPLPTPRSRPQVHLTEYVEHASASHPPGQGDFQLAPTLLRERRR